MISFSSHIIISILILTFTCFPAFTDGKTDEVDKLFTHWAKSDSPGCALAIVRDSEIVYKQGYGMANLEYDIPITPSTIFHIASISKQFTAFAILLLEDEGKLSLDDDIRKHLPEMHDFGKTITIRHLVHHISGLRDQWLLACMAGWRMDDVITQAHLLNLIFNQKELNFEPGEKYAYCNSGFTLMAEIVNRVSGQSFPEFCQQRIFQPLEMTSTHFHIDHEQIVKKRSYSYFASGDGFLNARLNYANVGATSLFTTVEDLVKWDHNFSEPKVGNAPVIEKMLVRGILNNGDEIDYACGLQIREYRGVKRVGHGGADAGYRTLYTRFPDQDFSVIIFSNASDFDYSLDKKIADIFLEDALEPETIKQENQNANKPKEIAYTPSKEDLNKYIGVYYSEELQTSYTVALTDKQQLILKHFRHAESKLVPKKQHRFTANIPAIGQYDIEFVCGPNDDCQKFLMSFGNGAVNVCFIKQ